MSTASSELPTHIEALREPWCWQQEIPYNTDRLVDSQQLALDGKGIATIFLPDRAADRIDELADLTIHRISSSRDITVGGMPAKSMQHFALTGGGVPVASMLGFAIAQKDPTIPFRLGYTSMTRYGNEQNGREELDIKQPPIAEMVHDADAVLTDDLIDHGTTLLLGAKYMIKSGVPYSQIGTFLYGALRDGVISEEDVRNLQNYHQEKFNGRRASDKLAKPESIAALVLADKQHSPDFENLFEFTDVGLLVPKPWLKRMGMDGPNEDGRWGKGIILSGTQELKFAQEIADLIDMLGELAVMSMDGKDTGVFWIEDGKPAKLPKNLF
jgi:hypoxanthine-guanine phosphoribosyltransferase